MTQTDILYALSTFAQTCAALAALVGAVGLFRLQVLRDRYRSADRDLRAFAELVAGRPNAVGDLDRIVKIVREGLNPGSPHYMDARAAIDVIVGFDTSYNASRSSLIVFEMWNLAVVCLSLV